MSGTSSTNGRDEICIKDFSQTSRKREKTWAIRRKWEDNMRRTNVKEIG